MAHVDIKRGHHIDVRPGVDNKTIVWDSVNKVLKLNLRTTPNIIFFDDFGDNRVNNRLPYDRYFITENNTVFYPATNRPEWIASGTYSVTNEKIKTTGGLTLPNLNFSTIHIYIKVRKTYNSYQVFRICILDNNNGYEFQLGNTNGTSLTNTSIKRFDAGARTYLTHTTTTVFGANDLNFHIVEAIRDASGNLSIIKDGTSILSTTDTTYSNFTKFICSSLTGEEWEIDYVYAMSV